AAVGHEPRAGRPALRGGDAHGPGAIVARAQRWDTGRHPGSGVGRRTWTPSPPRGGGRREAIRAVKGGVVVGEEAVRRPRARGRPRRTDGGREESCPVRRLRRVAGAGSGWRPILAAGALLIVLVAAGCATTAAAPAPSTPPPSPVPPLSLATIPPAKPPRAAGTATGGGPVVDIENFSFVPADVSVPVGTTLTWINHDDAPHTVTASDKQFGSPSIDPDGQYTFTFTTAGTYSYFCSIHPFMTARVTVK